MPAKHKAQLEGLDGAAVDVRTCRGSRSARPSPSGGRGGGRGGGKGGRALGPRAGQGRGAGPGTRGRRSVSGPVALVEAGRRRAAAEHGDASRGPRAARRGGAGAACGAGAVGGEARGRRRGGRRGRRPPVPPTICAASVQSICRARAARSVCARSDAGRCYGWRCENKQAPAPR